MMLWAGCGQARGAHYPPGAGGSCSVDNFVKNLSLEFFINALVFRKTGDHQGKIF